MTTEAIPSLYPEVAERNTPPGRGQHGYYKRRSDGWIITGGAWPSGKADKDFKGFDFLPSMGTFLMSFGDNEEESNQVDRRGRKFFPHKEFWRLILQHPDGPGLFPVSQIIAYRWHIRPPYREVKFPQLEGLQIYDLFCPECDKGIFSAEREQEAIEMLRIHLTSGFNDSHSYRPEDLRALGQEYSIDFFAPRRARNSVRARSIEPEPETAIEVTPLEVFLCPDCGFEAKNGFGLQAHRRSHKAAPVGSGS